MRKPNRYSQIIEAIFFKHYSKKKREVSFSRTEIPEMASKLGIELPKNFGDILYSFRYRTTLPQSIIAKAPEGFQWIIRPVGIARYKFVLVKQPHFIPSELLTQTKIPDATPGVISKYAMTYAQA